MIDISDIRPDFNNPKKFGQAYIRVDGKLIGYILRESFSLSDDQYYVCGIDALKDGRHETEEGARRSVRQYLNEGIIT